MENICVDIGGKGINVSRTIQALRGDSLCTGFVGGEEGRRLCLEMDRLGLRHRFIQVAGRTRMNLKVISEDGSLTEFNEPGPTATRQDVDALLALLMDYVAMDSIVVLGGSLCAGMEEKTYLTLISFLKDLGATVFLDADGAAFRWAMEAPPDYIKPNCDELLQYFGVLHPVEEGELISLCRGLVKKGIRLIALSMSSAGCFFITEDRCLCAQGLKVPVVSPVGAGDSMVGALALGLEQGLPLEETAALAVAVSAGSVSTRGTKPPDEATVRQLQKEVRLVELR